MLRWRVKSELDGATYADFVQLSKFIRDLRDSGGYDSLYLESVSLLRCDGVSGFLLRTISKAAWRVVTLSQPMSKRMTIEKTYYKGIEEECK